MNKLAITTASLILVFALSACNSSSTISTTQESSQNLTIEPTSDLDESQALDTSQPIESAPNLIQQEADQLLSDLDALNIDQDFPSLDDTDMQLE